MLPFWTLLSACEIRDKIHIIYKELTRDWVKSKVAKSEFYPLKSQKTGELRENSPLVALSSRWVFSQWGWIKRLEYVITFRLFTRKWHVMERSLMWLMEFDWSNTIQARKKFPAVHVMQWLGMFRLDFERVLVVPDGMQVVWRVSCENGGGKTRFNLKMIQ